MNLLAEYKKIKRIILETDDPTERKIRLLALLTSSLPKGGSNKPGPILTGGSAIEIYLDGTLRTGDMDLVYNTNELKKILKAWHFELGSALRSYANQELGLAIDLVGETLNGSKDRISTITTPYGPAFVIGIEDLILKRLASAKFWGTSIDMEQSYLLARAQEAKIDWKYLETQATNDGISDYLGKLKAMLKKSKKKKKK